MHAEGITAARVRELSAHSAVAWTRASAHDVCRGTRHDTSSLVEAPIVEAVGLRKRYDQQEVVCGVDFAVRPRECFGLLGPNGAGKTTTIRMLTCFATYDAGSLSVFGMPVNAANARAIKSRLGLAPQEENLDPDLTVAKNL